MVPVAHPVLRDITGDCLVAFHRAREQYERVMQDHKKAGSTAEPVTLKSSIDPTLLTELVELREFDGFTSVAALTDPAIRSWLDEQLKPDEDDLVSLKDIASAVRRGVRINTQETKPKFRIKRLFIDYRRFMRARGWNDIVETAMEESTAHICSLLQPPALRTRVQTAISRKKGAIHNDWNKFFEFCLEEAVTVDR